MWRRLQAARRLGGLAASLPREAEPLGVSRAVCGPAGWRVAAAHDALRSEGWSCGAATRAHDAPRGFCAAAGRGNDSAVPPAPAAAPPERDATTAARGDAVDQAKPATPAAAVARAPTRAKRAPNAGVRGEKAASGQPKPDVRTVARLVELGWCETAEATEAMLTRQKHRNRFAFETAGPAIDWLLNTLGEEKHRSGKCCAARAVSKSPLILARSVPSLQRGWETVISSREAGGLGLSEEVARHRVASTPYVLSFSDGFVQQRAAFLETLGVPDGCAAIAQNLIFLGFAEDRLRKRVQWLQSQGLDVKRILSSNPTVVMISAKALSPKLDFMRSVVGLDTSAISGRLLKASLDGVLRPRYFYVLQRGVMERYALGSLVHQSTAALLKMLHRLGRAATADEVAAYTAHIASPAFHAYMDEQEQQIRARSAKASGEAR